MNLTNRAKNFIPDFNNNMSVNRLLPKVSLPYNIIKGSVQDRQRKAIHIVDKFYRDLMPKFKRNQITVKELQKSIDDIFQKRVNIIVKENIDNNFFGGSDIEYSPISNCITGTTIEIPIIKKKIHITNMVTILHEFQHAVDQLFHPKYLNRNQFMYQNELYNNKYNNLYDNFIYRHENIENKKTKAKVIKKLEHKIRKYLRGYSAEDKINYLQDTRYNLMMENQAYYTQRKYAKAMNKKHIPILSEDLANENENHMFAEKIKLLNKLLAEIIKKERTKHAAKLRFAKHSRNLTNSRS